MPNSSSENSVLCTAEQRQYRTGHTSRRREQRRRRQSSFAGVVCRPAGAFIQTPCVFTTPYVSPAKEQTSTSSHSRYGRRTDSEIPFPSAPPLGQAEPFMPKRCEKSRTDKREQAAPAAATAMSLPKTPKPCAFRYYDRRRTAPQRHPAGSVPEDGEERARNDTRGNRDR